MRRLLHVEAAELIELVLNMDAEDSKAGPEHYEIVMIAGNVDKITSDIEAFCAFLPAEIDMNSIKVMADIVDDSIDAATVTIRTED